MTEEGRYRLRLVTYGALGCLAILLLLTLAPGLLLLLIRVLDHFLGHKHPYITF